MVDRDHLRSLYDRLSDEELTRVWGTELVDDARIVLQAEMTSRGLAPSSVAPGRTETRARRVRFNPGSPYLPPQALVADVNAEAAITARGLVRLFQWMVIATTTLGVLLFAWPYLGLPISQQVLDMRFAQIGGVWPDGAAIMYYGATASGLAGGIGLFFFRSWGRWLFVGSYILGTISTQLAGMVIWFPLELTLLTVMTLLDGAVLALAFLPPLSRYFETAD